MVTDARSLHDCLGKETGATRDRRLRLEVNLIRSTANLRARWISSEQMIADHLTKEVGQEVHDYAREVVESGKWCLGEDSRAPPTKRGRALQQPEQQQTAADADEDAGDQKQLYEEPNEENPEAIYTKEDQADHFRKALYGLQNTAQRWFERLSLSKTSSGGQTNG